MVQVLIQDGFMSGILCILFMIYVIMDRSFENKIKRFFLVITGIIFFLIVIDGLEMLESVKTVPTTMRNVYTSLGYMLRPTVPFFMTVILIHSTKTKTSKIEKVAFCMIYVFNFIVSGLSAFTGWVYYYDSANGFHRGILWITPFAAGFVYVLFMGYAAFIRIRIKRRGETVVFVILGFLCLFATAMEAWFHFVGFLTDVCIIGTVLYYLYLHVSIYSLDELTGTYSRRIFYLDANKYRHSGMILVTMDMNNLKVINDTHGHHIGDEALTEFSNTIVRDKGKNCSLYRMGGDEFYMLCRGVSREYVQKKLDNFEKDLAKKSISFAYGISEVRSEDNIEDRILDSDHKMYEMKRNMKEEN